MHGPWKDQQKVSHTTFTPRESHVTPRSMRPSTESQSHHWKVTSRRDHDQCAPPLHRKSVTLRHTTRKSRHAATTINAPLHSTESQLHYVTSRPDHDQCGHQQSQSLRYVIPLESHVTHRPRFNAPLNRKSVTLRYVTPRPRSIRPSTESQSLRYVTPLESHVTHRPRSMRPPSTESQSHYLKVTSRPDHNSIHQQKASHTTSHHWNVTACHTRPRSRC